MRPQGADWERALDDWRSLPTDDGATFDTEVTIDAAALRPYVTLGHEPGPVRDDRRRRARPGLVRRPREGARRRAAPSRTWRSRRAPRSATSAPTRSSSARARTRGSRTCASPRASSRGRKVADGLRALVVPGSFAGEGAGEQEGLDRVFADAGFEWRGAGCSMCLGMNPDILQPGERSACTRNRNFEGRQGKGGRTHLVSPRSPPPPRSPATSRPRRTSRWNRSASSRAPRCPLDRVRRRHRPDHPRRVPQAHRADRVRAVPVRTSGARIPTFVLNDQRYAGASILLAGANFGSGSSREHAPWAIEDAGFRAVIAPSFADIFRNNCTKIGPAAGRAAAGVGPRADGRGARRPDDADRRRPRRADGRAPPCRRDVRHRDFTRWRLLEGLTTSG